MVEKVVKAKKAVASDHYDAFCRFLSTFSPKGNEEDIEWLLIVFTKIWINIFFNIREIKLDTNILL